MDLKQQAYVHLTQKLIPFWSSLRDDKNGGFCDYVGFDLKRDPYSEKGCILNNRILWFFSKAYQLLDDPELLKAAAHAYRFVDCFWDHQDGGVYWACTYTGKPLDRMKHAYANAFCIYGLSAYGAASGLQEPIEKALELFHTIENRMADDVGYGEAFDSLFMPMDNSRLSDHPRLIAKRQVADKTMNTMLHLIEAYTTLYEVSKDAQVKKCLIALLQTMEEKVYNPQKNRLEVFFDHELHSIIDMQSYGHDIEASWLLDLAAKAVFQGEELKHWLALTTKLATGVAERAYDHDSLLNEWVEGNTDSARCWWVEAETVVGLTNLWGKTGEQQYLDTAEKTWNYIMNTLVDTRPGSEWFAGADERGIPRKSPIVEPWKCPYHNGRMCMELITRL
ncbi:MAG: AGE family epimerase/isomerase [Eubacteriales bacterium]|nr:AGE family epimerase/isomerase [Eubacteriales bacterium]